MRSMRVGATALALLGAAVLATAQAQDDRNKGPGAESQGRGSDGKGMQREQRGGESERSKQPTPGPGPKAEQRDDRSGRGAERSRDADRPRATEQRQPDRDRPRSTQQEQQQDREATQQQQQDRDRPKSTQERQDKDRPKATERQRKDDGPKSTEGTRPGKDRADDTAKGARVRTQVSEQQRSSVGQRIRQRRVDRVQRSRIDVNVNIGARLPRSVRLHVLPVFIFDDVPAYRGYSYVLLDDDTILIVDANTYVIIDVIPAGSLRADRPGRYLSLSGEQMRFVYANVRRDRTADVRVRLALGAEVPRSVELLAFPGDVIGRIGELERYRYVIADGDVVVVDPDDHAVVLVISE